MTSLEAVRMRCSWAYPYCTRIATKWIAKVPLCSEHYEPTLLSALNTSPSGVVRKPERFRTWPSVVYYVTWPGHHDDEVKIGVSAKLPFRLVALRRAGPAIPSVLVAEPGDHKLERKRHRQFSSLRLLDPVTGTQTEIFRRVPLLDEHINRLQREHPDWAMRAKL